MRLRTAIGACVAAFIAGFLLDQSGLIERQLTRYNDRVELRKLHAQTIANQEWAQKIIEGGYILHIRHAQRARWRDASAFDVWEARTGVDASQTDWANATCLTAQGVEEAKMLGRIFEAAGVEIGAVYSSPICRARQTAQLAFGDEFEVQNELLARTALKPQQRRDYSIALREFLMTIPIEAGKNTVLTGHGNTISNRQITVIDEVRLPAGGERYETGLLVFERRNGRLIAHHHFASLKDFANAVLEAPNP
ncbi:MAG: histidine phosphatase family protein [Pseudomonadota bacterium]